MKIKAPYGDGKMDVEQLNCFCPGCGKQGGLWAEPDALGDFYHGGSQCCALCGWNGCCLPSEPTAAGGQESPMVANVRAALAREASKPKEPATAPRCPYLTAYIWHCDDDVCECTQPKIDVVTQMAGTPHYRVENLWEGTFHSQAGADEQLGQRAELVQAAARYGITLADGSSGALEISIDQAVAYRCGHAPESL